MNMQPKKFLENMVNTLFDFQADYKNESANLSSENQENLINSVILGYNVNDDKVCADYCDGRFGTDIVAGSIYRENCINLSTDFLFLESRAEMLDFCKNAVADELDYFKNQDDAQKTLDFLRTL